MSYTDKELEKISRNMKALRPSIYDSATKVESQISLEFEAYLIIIADSLKDKMIDQLKLAKSSLQSTGVRKDKIDILSMCIETEKSNATTLSTLYNDKLTAFDTLRSSLKVEDNTGVSELGLFNDFSQKSLAELLFSRDRQKHLTNVLTYLKTLNTVDVDERIKELDYFIKAITLYKGTV